MALSTYAKENEKPSESAMTQQNCILSGKITDKASGEELAGVAVKLDGTNHVVFTDFEGNFSFKHINPGNYKIVVEYISYQKIEAENIVVKQDEIHELQLGLMQKN